MSKPGVEQKDMEWESIFKVGGISALIVTAFFLGETVLATSTGTGANMASFFLEGAAFVISIIMLRSGVFGKFTSYMGVIGHGLDLTRIVINLVLAPVVSLPFVSTIGFILLAIGGPLQLIWYALISRKLLQLGRR